MKCNKRQLAEIFGVTEESITNWMREGCPVEAKRRGSTGNVYDTAEVYRWRLAKAESRESTGSTDEARERLLRAQAEKVELEVAELHGDLLRTDDVLSEWTRLFAAARAKLLSLPSKLAPRIAPPALVAQAQEMARTFIDEALNELAGDGLPERARARKERAAGMASAAAADRKPVGRPRKAPQPRGKRGAGKVGDKPG